MNKLLPLLSLLFWVFISCEKPKRDTIEIYLTKERIPHKVGVPFEEIPNYVDIDLTDGGFGRYDNYFVSYDTIKENFIFLGEFDVTKEDLQSEPFIIDDEILGFDFEKSFLILKGETYKKFSESSPLSNLIQFVICVDKKPILNGYFLSAMSSAYFENYAIHYLPYSDNYKDKTIDLSLYLGKKFEGVEIPNFKSTNPIFYNTFLNRNKENNLFQE